MKELTDRLFDWDFRLITAKIQKELPNEEKIGNTQVYRCGLGHPIDKYLLPLLGPLKAIQIAKKDEVKAIWALMASYGGFAALVYSWLRPNTRFLLTLQEGDPLEYIEKRVGIFQLFFRRIFSRANAVQAISTFLADWSVRQGFKGVPVVIPNGVDVQAFVKPSTYTPEDRYQQRKNLGFHDSDFIIVTASRLVLKNATDDLIRALVHLPEDVKLLIVGDGLDRSMLELLALELSVEKRVLFLGAKSHRELPALLWACDLFCRPSLSEGLGNSFLEAMAAGLPIIGTPVGGIPDFLKDRETGLFCQPRHPESIASAVIVLRQNSELREQILHKSKSLVVSGYEWEGLASRTQKLIESL